MARGEAGVTREGWRLLWTTLLLQRRQLLTGVAVGLSWTLAKVAVPQLTRLAIDRGINESGSLPFWTALILAAVVAVAAFEPFGYTMFHAALAGACLMIATRCCTGPQARKAGQEDRNNGHVVLERENGDAVTKLGKTAAGGARSLGKYQQITTLVKQPTGVLERF